MTITTKFNIGDTVLIRELKITGRVIAIFYDGDGVGLQYNVKYFFNGDSKTTYLIEAELEVVAPSAAAPIGLSFVLP